MNLEETVKTGDYRESLVALRDLLARELQGNRCAKCQSSQLRTGDLAALALRLQKVMEDIQAIPAQDAEVSELDRIRQRRAAGAPAPSNIQSSGLGTKSGPRRQGGRAPSGTRQPGA